MRHTRPGRRAEKGDERGPTGSRGAHAAALNARDRPAAGVASGAASACPDPSWRDLYRAGGAAATLRYIAAHKAVYVIELVSFVGLGLPALVVFLALFVALRPLSQGYAALGAAIGGASEVAALAYNSSPQSLTGALVSLSDQYVAAAGIEQRAALAAAAEGLVAVSNAVNAAGILTALGILILSLVMRGGVFPRGIAYLGIVTGALGVVSEALRPLIGPGYAIYGLLLPIWFVAVGWRLFRLAGTSSSPESATG